jgi:SET domain-containing protein
MPSERDGIDGSIFLFTSRINHRCVPNAMHSWKEQLDGGSLTLPAARDVAKEEEIMISYPPVKTFC